MNYSAEDLDFMDEVRTWFLDNTPERLKGQAFMFGDMTADDNVDWCRKLNQRGWAAINWPKEYGGTDWPVHWPFILEEEMAHAGCPPVLPFNIKMLGQADCDAIMDHNHIKPV